MEQVESVASNGVRTMIISISDHSVVEYESSLCDAFPAAGPYAADVYLRSLPLVLLLKICTLYTDLKEAL